MKLSQNAMTVLQKRYLVQHSNGEYESPNDLFIRVANNIAQADRLYGATDEEIEHSAQQFFSVLNSLEFLPNSPTLRGAGRELQQLSACFVLPIEDTIDGIMEALKASVYVHKTGGGTGFAFSRLRPAGDYLSTGGKAGGPISFMRIFNAAAQEITQGGVRMGANMGILTVHHPDIMQFIHCKSDGTSLTNFNISVAATDKFMTAVLNDNMYDLINPRNNEVVAQLRARDVFEAIAEEAWKTGDPGLIFIDTINNNHPAANVGLIESTNPCGEQPLLPYESCNLGSIDLAKLVKNGNVDMTRLQNIIHIAVHFLDNVIDMNNYVLSEIAEATRGTRKIGLGVMGFADMLVQLGIPYNSEQALQMAESLIKFINERAYAESVMLAESRGVYPYHTGSQYDIDGVKIRNACRTTIAPTGTLSTLADTSSGIEPIYAVIHNRMTLFNAQGHTESLLVVNKYFENALKSRGIYSEDLIQHITAVGLQHANVPDDIKRVFVTTFDITPEWHVRMQAVFQKYVDSAVSKTINLVNKATVDDVRTAYLLAYELGCKGITIYRDGSRSEQVLTVVKPSNSLETTLSENKPAYGLRSKPEDELATRSRPAILTGKTYRKNTALGSAYITINRNGTDEAFETFVNVGKAGSDIAADAEGLGRLISFILRMPSPMTVQDRIENVVAQLGGIGSGRQHGFGKQRVMSLPDAIAQVLAEHISMTGELPKLPEYENGDVVEMPAGTYELHNADICPGCGNASLMRVEGCQKCYGCGHSQC